MIKMIAAMSKNRVIGNNGIIPWYNKDEFKHFKDTTMNQSILMGSKTWFSLPKRPLPNRVNYVVSSHEIESAITLNDTIIPEYSTDDLFIIGGENIYRQYINRVDQIILSTMNLSCDGDSFFPEIPEYFKLSETIDHGDFIVERYENC